MGHGRKLKRIVEISWVDVQREANVLEMMLISVRPGKSGLGVGSLAWLGSRSVAGEKLSHQCQDFRLASP